MSDPNEPIHFQFKWLNDNANPKGFRKKKGRFENGSLFLEDTEFPADSIATFYVDEEIESIVISLPLDEDFDPDDPLLEIEHYSAMFKTYGIDIKDLARAVNASRSDRVAELEMERLAEEGEAENFRVEQCPHCEATIVLTDYEETPQIYCEFCSTLFAASVDSYTETATREFENAYRICEKCEMYSKPTQFSIFYFYFLIVVWGVHHDKTTRCPACFRSEAWKMMFGNLFGLLGMPVAITQLIRSYRMRPTEGPLQNLDDANALARRGKVDKALDMYDEIMDGMPNNAGIKYNIGQGLLRKKDYPHALTMFELALGDCANYDPALIGQAECQMHAKKDPQLLDS